MMVLFFSDILGVPLFCVVVAFPDAPLSGV